MSKPSQLPVSATRSKTPMPAAQRVNLYIGMAFLFALLMVMLWGVLQLMQWLEDEQKTPLNRVVISGQRTYLDDKTIERLVRAAQPGSFFELDVEQTHQLVEAMPWVYRASVRKRWPNGLEIYVVEQVPAARWNDDLLLNQYGEVFDGIAIADAKQLPLPRLFGPGGSEQTALQGYRDMQSLLESTQLQINELFLSERFAWNVQLTNGIKLNLGRSEFIDRLQRFVDVLPLISQQNKAIDYVDLRYDTGLAVGWLKPAEKSSDNKQQES